MSGVSDDLLVWLRSYLWPKSGKGSQLYVCREAADEIERLRLQLERDAVTYATMQKGMESQAELMDGLKQRVRELETALKPFAVKISADRLDSSPQHVICRADDCRRALQLLEGGR